MRSVAAVTGAVLVAGALGSASAVAAAAPSYAASVNNPYSPAYQHAYRHGVVPTISQNKKIKSWAANAVTPAVATGPETLSYGGGNAGVGVNSGHAKVYLVFYGTQWGTQTTDANGDLKFSGDADGAASAAQEMFKGIGTNGELWSADLTQWCDGPNVATGATSCPANANFVPYQAGGVLSGVWYDNSGASPSAATGHQLGVEAVNAAGHFGNTTTASNRNAYYVILSPHGTDPDGYESPTTGYCAWHDWNGDTSLTGGAVSSAYGNLAFSNQPYNMDQGQNCGVGFINSPGTLDGYTMTLGHEFHEMMSDMYPSGGWTNNTGNATYNGEENSDECAWLAPGTAGGGANVTFATGTFAEQASWSNDTNACAISHPIVNHGNTVTVTNPGSQSGTVGTAASLQIAATDSASGQTLTYTAAGLPAGLSISTSGLISGTPTAAATSSVSVTATDTTGAAGSASFTWTVGSVAGNTVTVTNPGSQSGTVGTAASLQVNGSDSASGQTLTYTAAGLPAGLSISTSGLISGTPTAAATSSVTVTATDTTGAHGSATFSWTVGSASGGGCTAAQLITNPSFSTGSISPWTATAGVFNTDTTDEPAYVGSYDAWLDGYGASHTDTLAQTVTIPSTCKTASFSTWVHIDSQDSAQNATLSIQVLNSSGTVLTTLATLTNLQAASGYTQYTYNLAPYIGQKVTLKFTGKETGSIDSSFVVGDNALNVN